jgi:hypothetical protein
LSSFLDSYGANTQPQAQPQPQPKPVDTHALPQPSSAEVHALRQQVGLFNGMVAAMYEHQLRQEAQADFEGAVGRANKMLQDSDRSVSKDFARLVDSRSSTTARARASVR